MVINEHRYENAIIHNMHFSHFSSLNVNTATDTLCSILTSSLDKIYPLSSRQARTTTSNPWLSEVLCEHRTELRAPYERKIYLTIYYLKYIVIFYFPFHVPVYYILEIHGVIY